MRLLLIISFCLSVIFYLPAILWKPGPQSPSSYMVLQVIIPIVLMEKKTANGEIYSHKKMTAACNVLPLGTWIRVTNLRNGKSVVVKTNDRLHTRMKRVVDLSRKAADKLDYVKSGLTRVRVEVIGKKKPEK